MRTGSTKAAVTVAWAAQMTIEQHHCGGRCDACPAEPGKTCRRLQEARLDVATLGLPHPRH